MNLKPPGAAMALVVVLAACGVGSATSSPGRAAASVPAMSSPGRAASREPATPIVVKDFTLDPKDVTLDGPSALAVSNAGPTIHNVTIRDGSGTILGATPDLKTGESATLSVSVPPGSYVLYCSLPGHESLGIKGTLIVSD